MGLFTNKDKKTKLENKIKKNDYPYECYFVNGEVIDSSRRILSFMLQPYPGTTNKSGFLYPTFNNGAENVTYKEFFQYLPKHALTDVNLESARELVGTEGLLVGVDKFENFRNKYKVLNVTGDQTNGFSAISPFQMKALPNYRLIELKYNTTGRNYTYAIVSGKEGDELFIEQSVTSLFEKYKQEVDTTDTKLQNKEDAKVVDKYSNKFTSILNLLREQTANTANPVVGHTITSTEATETGLNITQYVGISIPNKLRPNNPVLCYVDRNTDDFIIDGNSTGLNFVDEEYSVLVPTIRKYLDSINVKDTEVKPHLEKIATKLKGKGVKSSDIHVNTKVESNMMSIKVKLPVGQDYLQYSVNSQLASAIMRKYSVQNNGKSTFAHDIISSYSDFKSADVDDIADIMHVYYANTSKVYTYAQHLYNNFKNYTRVEAKFYFGKNKTIHVTFRVHDNFATAEKSTTCPPLVGYIDCQFNLNDNSLVIKNLINKEEEEIITTIENIETTSYSTVANIIHKELQTLFTEAHNIWSYMYKLRWNTKISKENSIKTSDVERQPDSTKFKIRLMSPTNHAKYIEYHINYRTKEAEIKSTFGEKVEYIYWLEDYSTVDADEMANRLIELYQGETEIPATVTLLQSYFRTANDIRVHKRSWDTEWHCQQVRVDVTSHVGSNTITDVIIIVPYEYIGRTTWKVAYGGLSKKIDFLDVENEVAFTRDNVSILAKNIKNEANKLSQLNVGIGTYLNKVADILRNSSSIKLNVARNNSGNLATVRASLNTGAYIDYQISYKGKGFRFGGPLASNLGHISRYNSVNKDSWIYTLYDPEITATDMIFALEDAAVNGVSKSSTNWEDRLSNL